MKDIKTLAALKRAIKVGSKLYCTYCRSLEREQEAINRMKNIGGFDNDKLDKRQADINIRRGKMYNTRTVEEVGSSYIRIEGSRLDWPKAKDIEITDEGFDVYWEEYVDREKQRNKILSYVVISF